MSNRIIYLKSEAPIIVGQNGTLSNAYSVHVYGDYAYVSDLGWGLKIFDISVPEIPVFKKTVSGGARYSYAVGTKLYVGGYDSMKVLDITDPINPIELGSLPLPQNVYGLEVSGNYAYVGDYSAGVQVVDIADPANMSVVETFSSDSVYGVYIVGTKLYCTGPQFIILDITNPLNISELGRFASSTCYNTIVVGDYAYVANSVYGMRIFNISNPASISIESAWDKTGPYCRDLDIFGDYLFTAWYSITDYANCGMTVLDVSDVTNPLFRSHLYIYKYNMSTQYHSDGYVYQVANPNLFIIDPNLPN